MSRACRLPCRRRPNRSRPLPPYLRPALPDRVRIVEIARRWDRDLRPAGAVCGPLGGPRGVAVLGAIALAGTSEPSIDDLRREAGVSRDTVCAVLGLLREIGLVEVDPRYRLVPRPNGRGQQARRLPNRYRLPPLAAVEARYESALRTASDTEDNSLSARRAPPRRTPGDKSLDAWAAPGAGPAEAEDEIEVEIRPAAPEIAREDAAGGGAGAMLATERARAAPVCAQTETGGGEGEVPGASPPFRPGGPAGPGRTPAEPRQNPGRTPAEIAQARARRLWGGLPGEWVPRAGKPLLRHPGARAPASSLESPPAARPRARAAPD